MYVMYVCMYVIYVCMCVCMSVCMYVCMYWHPARRHYIYPELRHGFWKCWDKLSLLLSTLWATEQLKLLRIFFQDSCRSSGYIVTTSEPSVFSTHLHSLAATLMESENSSFIDKIWSQPPLAVATQQGRKDVIKACVALSFDMISASKSSIK